MEVEGERRCDCRLTGEMNEEEEEEGVCTPSIPSIPTITTTRKNTALSISRFPPQRGRRADAPPTLLVAPRCIVWQTCDRRKIKWRTKGVTHRRCRGQCSDGELSGRPRVAIYKMKPRAKYGLLSTLCGRDRRHAVTRVPPAGYLLLPKKIRRKISKNVYMPDRSDDDHPINRTGLCLKQLAAVIKPHVSI